MHMWTREGRTDPEVSYKVPASFEASHSLQARGQVVVLYLQQNEGSYFGCPESPREFEHSRFSNASISYHHPKSQDLIQSL